ncbi:MAG: hypothetical protein Q4A34_00195 [Candidatus Saccharibacteria bacterium]|nr:hypothetical protein [Candidatus Saccharibacteria bacterium]
MDNSTHQVASQSNEGAQHLSLTAGQLPARLYTKYRAVRIMAASVVAGAVYVIVKFAVEAAENSTPFIIDTLGLALFVLFGLLSIVVTVLYNTTIREIAEWRRVSVKRP